MIGVKLLILIIFFEAAIFQFGVWLSFRFFSKTKEHQQTRK